MTDNEIIKSILNGDRNRYKTLVERYQSMVFRTCLGFVHIKEDADDLTQEIFIQAYQSLYSFKGDASFSTWLYRIAVNASLNKVRRSSKFKLLQRIDRLFGSARGNETTHPNMQTEDPENILIRAEQRECVQKALDSLPEKQRIAIVLSKYDDLSQKEIAEIMNTTEGAVESLLQRAKTNMRVKLMGNDEKNKI